jgi:riboflavin biosynthesis pyrimidine reductase
VQPLAVLYDAAEPAFDLPEELRRLYDGSLGFAEPRVFANFVSTLDGVVAIPSVARSNELISGGSEADRFVMGLLRACAEVVLIGSGTLHASPHGTWTAERAYPPAADDFATLRRELRHAPEPELVVLTRSGALDASHPVFSTGAVVLTTDRGEARLRSRLPPATAVVSLGDEIDPVDALAVVHERGHALVLTEGGPTVFGSLVDAGLVDELFLTLSPLLAGRAEGDRLQLIEGASFLPGLVEGRLLSARESESQLFLRYALRRNSGSAAS